MTTGRKKEQYNIMKTEQYDMIEKNQFKIKWC
jgi:hypothetical protein